MRLSLVGLAYYRPYEEGCVGTGSRWTLGWKVKSWELHLYVIMGLFKK